VNLEERKRLVISTGETQTLPTQAGILVRCTACGECERVVVPLSSILDYTGNGDGTYTAPWKICADCAEWERLGYSDRAVWWFIISLCIIAVWVAYLATR
jgi:hypothetical protein